MIKPHVLTAIGAFGALAFIPTASANSPLPPSISVRADGPAAQYGYTSCTAAPCTPAQANAPSSSVRANVPIVQYGPSTGTKNVGSADWQSSTCQPKAIQKHKNPKDQSQWGEWAATALSNIPEVRNELDSWSQYAESRPHIIVGTSDPAPPSENTSFPLGLSTGKQPTLTVYVTPKTQGEEDSGTTFPPYMLKLRPLLSEAYSQLTQQYYQLGGAYLRQDLLSQRRQALEELREINREAANNGDGSWAGIIYLDNLLEEVNEKIAKNDLQINILSYHFKKLPALSELAMGSLHVWQEDDFWDFYPKTPSSVGPEEIPGNEVNQLLEQLRAATGVVSKTRTSTSLQGLIDQLDSEPAASDADFAAGEEIVTVAKLEELEARLAYVGALIGAHEGAQVVFSFGAPTPSNPTVKSQAWCGASNYAKDGSGGSGKLLGISLVAAFILGLWYFRRANENDETEPTNPPRDKVDQNTPDSDPSSDPQGEQPQS